MVLGNILGKERLARLPRVHAVTPTDATHCWRKATGACLNFIFGGSREEGELRVVNRRCAAPSATGHSDYPAALPGV